MPAGKAQNNLNLILINCGRKWPRFRTQYWRYTKIFHKITARDCLFQLAKFHDQMNYNSKYIVT